MDSDALTFKKIEYCTAIEKYHTTAWYGKAEIISSICVIALQAATLLQLIAHYTPISVIQLIITLMIAYTLADFISGIAHMIGDNNTNYTSFIGPFVAAFHLHHTKLTYQTQHPLKIYFYESGDKFWLVLYLLILFGIQHYAHLNFYVALCLVTFAFLSSLSELSHFWCHNGAKGNKVVLWLQKYRILLHMSHHRIHHTADNSHYAFLNGMTDPLLNWIAKKLYAGYKNNSDKHVSAYVRATQE